MSQAQDASDDDHASHDSGHLEDTQPIVGQMYGGLTFLNTNNRPAVLEFYQDRLGMNVWLEQPDITILSHGNLLLGFHQVPEENEPDLHGVITLVYPTAAAVGRMYEKLRDIAAEAPRINQQYRIYSFFFNDPEGRTLECQAFLHDVTRVSSKPPPKKRRNSKDVGGIALSLID